MRNDGTSQAHVNPTSPAHEDMSCPTAESVRTHFTGQQYAKMTDEEDWSAEPSSSAGHATAGTRDGVTRNLTSLFEQESANAVNADTAFVCVKREPSSSPERSPPRGVIPMKAPPAKPPPSKAPPAAQQQQAAPPPPFVNQQAVASDNQDETLVFTTLPPDLQCYGTERGSVSFLRRRRLSKSESST